MTHRHRLWLILGLLGVLAAWLVWWSRQYLVEGDMWASLGRRWVWNANRATIVRVDGVEIRKVVPREDGGVYAVLSMEDHRHPDQSSVYELLSVDPTGRLQWRTRLPGLPGHLLRSHVVWTADRLWYLADRYPMRLVGDTWEAHKDEGLSQIYQVRLADGKLDTVNPPAPLARPEVGIYGLAVSPSGRRILLYARPKTHEDFKALPQILAAASISAEGRKRYLKAAVDPFSYILVWLVDHRAGTAKLLDLARPGVHLEFLPNMDSRMEWSADERWLLMELGTSAGVYAIAVMNGNGDNYRVVAQDRSWATNYPTINLGPSSWSPDFRYVYYSYYGPGREQNWRYDPVRGKKEAIARFSPLPNNLPTELAPGVHMVWEENSDRVILYHPSASLVGQIKSAKDWQAHVKAGRIPRTVLFQGKQLREWTISRNKEWFYGVLSGPAEGRQEICGVRLADPGHTFCPLVVQAPPKPSESPGHTAGLIEPSSAPDFSGFNLRRSRLLADGVRLQVRARKDLEVTTVVLDPLRHPLRPAFADGRDWLSAADLRATRSPLLILNGPPAGGEAGGRVAGDLYDGQHLYRTADAPALRRKTALRYHLRLPKDGLPVFGRGNFSGTYSDRAFIGGLGVLFNPECSEEQSRSCNDPSLWQAFRGDASAARSALGSLADGRLVLVLARHRHDPRQGPTLPELARMLLGMGLQEAYFLDGGSAALLLEPGEAAGGAGRSFLVVNRS